MIKRVLEVFLRSEMKLKVRPLAPVFLAALILTSMSYVCASIIFFAFSPLMWVTHPAYQFYTTLGIILMEVNLIAWLVLKLVIFYRVGKRVDLRSDMFSIIVLLIAGSCIGVILGIFLNWAIESFARTPLVPEPPLVHKEFLWILCDIVNRIILPTLEAFFLYFAAMAIAYLRTSRSQC